MNNKDVLLFILKVEEGLKEIDVRYERQFLITRIFLYTSFRSAKRKKKKNYKNLMFGFFINLFSLFYFRKMMEKENMIVTPNSHYNVFVKGGGVSKHVAGLMSVLSNVSVFSNGTNYRVNLPNLDLFFQVFFKFSKKNHIEDSKFVNDFVSVFKSTSLSMGMNEKFSPYDIRYWLEKSKKSLEFYSYMIPSNIKLKSVYFIAYYNFNTIGLIEALKNKGVECVDYQHGIQNDYHPMYSKLTNLECSFGMPTKFWMWDSVSNNRIVSSVGEKKAKEVGNLWFKTSKYKESFQLLPRPQKTILVALQLWPNYFNFKVLNVVSKNKDILWVFREHPLNLLSHEVKEDLLNKNENIIFENIDEVSVESSIQSSCLCMTGYSTVAIEAYYSGKKAVFFHENAKYGLSKYIDDRNIFYADDEEGIQKIIDLIFN
ncbi:hypothetical protein [Marinomonas sp. TW1]|uniref:hypothetical protein n=1 Tax=Marinomonas sp. TW1 TaxID=1561203 RepID=UPI0007AFA466|nr:hypothetical protein [Marinomonas sp. TW1]KZN15066.1 hypothetical protein OA79_02375 [Marinomonas sp. TW1]